MRDLSKAYEQLVNATDLTEIYRL
jgi:hypothetical protein